MSWAKVGMKVVCVDAGGLGVWQNDAPTEGKIYTISRVFTPLETGSLSFEFNELKRSVRSRIDVGFHCGYKASRFRPLVTKTQSEDVAMFKRIANNAPSMEEVE